LCWVGRQRRESKSAGARYRSSLLADRKLRAFVEKDICFWRVPSGVGVFRLRSATASLRSRWQACKGWQAWKERDRLCLRKPPARSVRLRP